ncbi:MAG: GAF domain-containing protein [Abitibacteriaceae bacterium]|nr:GAF domain-containing protein [Abditibacteriaceae bacterium]
MNNSSNSSASHDSANGVSSPSATTSNDLTTSPPIAGTSSLTAGADLTQGLPTKAELEQTLQRLVHRVAMLLQAERCVFLLHDRERNELVARPPALGLNLNQVRTLRLPVDRGVTGAAFASGEPVIVQDAKMGLPVDQAWMKRLDVRSLIAYPLVMERRDEQERVMDRVTLGVLHVMNKRGKASFNQDDLRLLSVMARQVTAVLASAQVYLALNQEREQLQATLHSLMAGVLMVESSGEISLINPVAREICDLHREDVIGHRYDEVVTRQAIVEMLRLALKDGTETQEELEITIPEWGPEPRIYQGQTTMVHADGENSAVIGVVAVFNDITEIRNVERMKTAFVSTVSHELRTPLTSIKGFISTLLQDPDDYYDKATRTEFYEIIDSECDRLRRLIEDLLNVSRIESGRALQMNWSTFDPCPIFERVIQAQHSYTDKHQIKLLAIGDVPEILGDADKLDQIMTNLISNAIKYSPSGGDIIVEVGKVDEFLRVAVRDQGIGIPAEKAARIFEKFERIDNADTRQAGGTGIGLYLVKHLVERHEGRVWLESEPGKGSSFIFEIPLRPPLALEEMQELANNAGQQRQGHRPPQGFSR